MSIVSCWTLAVVALSQLLLPPAFAAQQLVPTKTMLVKNPPSGARKVLWKVKATTPTVVGNPITQGGATLRIQLTAGGAGADQCVTMPASGWSAIGTIGFKYKDATLTHGPVKVAQIKKTPSGTFLMKALLKNGGPASIAITPGNPTDYYATNFTLGMGDEYCGGTGSATPNPNDATTFKVSNDGAPSVSCIAPCNGASVTTTSTTSSTLDCGTPPCGPTTTSTTTASSSSTTSTIVQIACNWPGEARWLSHGYDLGNAFATGAWLSCTAGVLSDVQFVYGGGTFLNPPSQGTSDTRVGCNWVGVRWASQGYDGAAAFTAGTTVSCDGDDVTGLAWESDVLGATAATAGNLACNWTGAVYLSHGLDAGCAFQTGFNVTCNANQITHFEWVEGLGCPRSR
jgi:hypothetical protein